jgi:hypothetical protein
MSENTTWDLGRFLRTLFFFQALPRLESLSQCPLLRQFFPALHRLPATQQTLTEPTTSDSEQVLSKTVFDFRQPQPADANLWGALDDVVMGGVSASQFRLQPGQAVFSGQVSTANSGGFASVRTRNFSPPLDLSGFAGIELVLQGDGNRYKFFVRTDERWDGVGYAYSFDTTAGEPQTIKVPFSAFVPVFRARRVAASPLEPAQVYSLQLMLSKFEYDRELNPRFTPGEFALTIITIGAYRD